MFLWGTLSQPHFGIPVYLLNVSARMLTFDKQVYVGKIIIVVNKKCTTFGYLISWCVSCLLFSYRRKPIRSFHTPGNAGWRLYSTLYFKPPFGWVAGNVRLIYIEKMIDWYQDIGGDMFSRFVTKHACDMERQTDGQTELRSSILR